MGKLLTVCMVLIVCIPFQGLCTDDWTYYSTESGLGSNAITDMFFTDDGTLWCVHDTYRDSETSYAMSGYTGSGWIHIGLDEFPTEGYESGAYRLSIKEARPFGNTILIATSQGLFQYDGTDITRVDAFGDFVITSAYMRDDTIWASGMFSAWGRNTISYTNGSAVETYYTGPDSWDNYHRILGYDSDGNLWTSGGNEQTQGIYRYDGEHWNQALAGDQYEGMCPMPDGSLWFWGEDVLLLILEDGEFGNADVWTYDLDCSVEGEAWCIAPVILYMIKDGISYMLNTSNLYENMEGIPDHFGGNDLCVAADDTSVWVGSNEYGVLQLSKTYLEPYQDDTSALSSENIVSMRNPSIGYGDDYQYYPMHIGDTWTYQRSYNFGHNDEYSDILHRTIIDTVWVDGEVYFEFLDGELARNDTVLDIVYRQGALRLDFRSLEISEYKYGASYYPRRETIVFDVPAGQFGGYDFITFDAEITQYGVIPYIGEGALTWWSDTGEFEYLKLISASINGKSIEEILAVEESSPVAINLSAFPNPFNPRTTISFTVPDAALVTLSVYSVTGQKVATLVNGQVAAGTYEIMFDGNGLASGVYVIRLEAGNMVEHRKMLLMK